jgi:hypothetical protein
MRPRRPPDRLNRLALGAVGMLLAGASTTGLLVSFGALGAGKSHEPVLADATRRLVDRNAGWWWPTAAALALLLAFVGYRWLRAQLPVDTGDDVYLATSEGATALVTGRALSRAIAADAERSPGVQAASARVVDPEAPEAADSLSNRVMVALRVRADDTTASSDLAADLRQRVLANAGRALDADSVTATVRVDLVGDST